MTKEAKLDIVRAGLRGYDRLERKAVSEVEWIAFKLGISQDEAARLRLRYQEGGDEMTSRYMKVAVAWYSARFVYVSCYAC